MRLGILSDVHANLEALEAVLASLDREAVDACYCLGDTVGYGGSPEPCVNLIRTRCHASVLGNHDAAVAGRMNTFAYYSAARQALRVHARDLSPANLRWLQGLEYVLALPKADLLLCHGSPLCPEEFGYVFTRRQARECLEVFDRLPRLTLVGHSHLCKVYALGEDTVEELPTGSLELRPDRKYVCSVGSVGQPRDYDARASYVVYDTEAARLEFHRVGYDIETAAEKILQANLERDFALRLFPGGELAYALRALSLS